MANNDVKISDQSTENLNQTEAFVSKHRNALIVAIVVIILIVVGIVLYRNYVAVPREVKASTAISVPQDLFANEAYDQAAEGFKKIINDYSGTKAANLANLYLGLCYANQEKWDDAVKYLEKFSPKDDAMLSPTAMAALGQAYANTNNIDKAITTLKKAAQMADKQAIDGANYSISATFLISAGTLLENQGKNEEALALYKEIKEKYVNSQQVQSKEIDKYIERVEEK